MKTAPQRAHAAALPDARGLRIPERTLELLRDLIASHAGMHYDDGRLEILRDRIVPLAIERGFDSLLDYYYLLKYDTLAASEWPRVMDALSVQETYFWREIDQLRALVDEIVPVLAKAGDPVRIWCVPCASGEEPLSLAMLLDEAGWFDRARIEIHASDASASAIARARAGRFRERSFRTLPPALRAKHFTADGDTWVVDPALHARVRSWSVVNLMCHGDVSLYARVPVIVCRNVFIYFSPEAITRVARTFAGAMPTPAYLCIGASESLLKLRTPFDLREIGGAFVYVKDDRHA